MPTLDDQYEELMKMSQANHISDDDLAMYDYDDYADESFVTEEEVKARERKANNPTAPENDSHADKPTLDNDDNEKFSENYHEYHKRRVHKYTKTELENIRKSCEGMLVRDYHEDDPYHWDDERRANMDALVEMDAEINKLRRVYHQPDKYVEAMRVIKKAWALIEKNFNVVHSKKEFFQMVGNGEIVNGRLVMPKLTHMNQYDLDTLIMYISNDDLDPMDLLDEKSRIAAEQEKLERQMAIENATDDDKFNQVLTKCADLLTTAKQNIDPFYADVPEDDNEDGDNKDEEEDMPTQAEIDAEITAAIMTPEELEMIEQLKDNPPIYEVREFERKYVKGYNNSALGHRRRTKKKSKKDKINEARTAAVHKLLKRIQDVERDVNDGRDYISNGLFDLSNHKDDFDDFTMRGSLASNANDELFSMMMTEKFMNMPADSSGYGGNTIGDVELQKFFEVIDKNPIFNSQAIRRSMNASPEQLSKEYGKRTRKENAKLEKRILDRIIKLNNNPKFKKKTTRTEQRLAKDIEGDDDD